MKNEAEELFDRLLAAITDEELEKYDIYFSVVDNSPKLRLYEVDHE